MPSLLHLSWLAPLKEGESWHPLLRHYLMSINHYLPRLPLGAFFATILVTTVRTAPVTSVPTASRRPQDILHICACELGAPFASVGAILIESAHNDFAEIVINQATFQMTVHLQTCPWNRQTTSLEMGHLCDKLQQELIELVPGAQVYERGNVTVSYLNGHTFLLCVLHCLFFPLGLALYMEDQYTFTLGPRSFSLTPVPEGEPTPVPILLFTS